MRVRHKGRSGKFVSAERMGDGWAKGNGWRPRLLASCSVFLGMSDPALMGNERRANHTATVWQRLALLQWLVMCRVSGGLFS